MSRKTADLQRQVERLVLEVEALVLEAGGEFPAEELLRRLEQLAARLSAYRPDSVPPDVLELEVAIRSVRAGLERERAYMRWMQSRPLVRLMTYQLLWLVSLALLVALYYRRDGNDQLTPGLQVLLGCMLWGAVGAIFSSIVALIRRRAERTLLPTYEPWHYMKPLVGGFTGALVYLILAGGVRFFNPEAGIPDGPLGFLAAAVSQFRLAFLLAALSGFQERTFFNKLDALIKVLLGSTAPPTPTCCCCHGHHQPEEAAGPGAGTCPRCGSSPPDGPGGTP